MPEHPAPITVDFLLLSGLSLMCLASGVDPLRAANRVSGRELFRWRMSSLNAQPVRTTCGVSIPVDTAFDARRCDVLVVIAGFGVREGVGRGLLASLRAAAVRSQWVVGVESGPWLMAMAGLLEGRRATTHWEDLEDFQTRHPTLRVCPDRYVVDGTRVTTGGASPTFDFMLQFIRARFGNHLALDVASVFGYDESHAAHDAQPLLSLGRLRRHEPRVAAAIRIMEAHMDNPLTQRALAAKAGVTVRTLEKLFATSIGQSPGQFFLGLRLGAARRMVVDTRLSLGEVAVRCGFSSASSFARAFRRHYGTSARELRARSTALAV